MFIQIEISTHCNFSCFYCAGRDMVQEYMALDVFDRILDRLPPGQHLVCLQGEGEPMLHPHFWEMVARVRARNHLAHTITNGSRIDADRIANALPYITISIDTLDPAEAERIGRKKLDKVLRKLDRLIARMGADRIEIATVDYGQSLDELRAFVQAKGFRSHLVQPLQVKHDYRRRYLDREAPEERYTYRCRYLEQPLQRTYGMDGREFPCCYIKDPTGYESIDALRTALASQTVPACCRGCREILASALKPHRLPTRNFQAQISFVVPVKGRLDQLRISLPHLVRHANCEVIVVDYDCPNQTREWVVSTFPQISVVHLSNAPVLNLSHARNLGGAYASGEWICFLDADAILGDDFFRIAQPTLSATSYILFASDWPGLVLCRADDFRTIDGFDETFEGWGCADNDFVMRLSGLGREARLLPTGLVTLLPHDDTQRMAHYGHLDKWLSLRINGMYLQIKTDLAKVLGKIELPRDELRPIYQEIKRVVMEDPSGPFEIKVSLPRWTNFRRPLGWALRREWTYRFERDELGGAAGLQDTDELADAFPG